MRTLVTGGAGFIGSTLVDRLLADGGEVVAVDNFDPFYDPAIKRANLAGAGACPRFRLVEADIRDGEAIRRAVAEFAPDAIAHIAARAGVRPSLERPALYAEVNVVGTANVLDAACRLRPMPRLVFASSSSVYGERPDAPFRESDPVDRPISPYAATKRACELLARTFHLAHGLDVTGLRFFTAYGPRNRPDLAVAKFARLIDRGEPIPVFGDGTSRRDYTYVDDLADGVARAIDRCRGFHIYNLGNSSPVELRTMVATLGEALGREPVLRFLPEQPGDVRQTYADISLAAAELGYAPATPFAEGIARFVAWYRA